MGDDPYRGQPAHGFRLEVVLEGEGDREPIVYAGRLHLEGASVPVRVEATRAAASVELGPCDLAGASLDKLRKAVGALVRAATRAELEQGERPPRKIVRWRAL